MLTLQNSGPRSKNSTHKLVRRPRPPLSITMTSASDIGNEPGGPVCFENPSDTIFARLFLPVSSSDINLSTASFLHEPKSIPWQFCDRILNIIRDPRFKPMEISFEDSGDMFRSIGQRRNKAWSVVEARPTCNSSFPLVILDGVLDFLKEDMIKAQNTSNHVGGIWSAATEVPEWKKTLQNMMFVHSSWHFSVKRLLGYSVVSSHGPGPSFIQNPLFGGWTRELSLSFNESNVREEDSNSSSPLSPFAPGKPYGFFLSTLCTRIPNTRLVHFSLSEFCGTSLATVCNALSLLPSLEELQLEAKCNFFPLQSITTAISATHLPALRSLRLYGWRFKFDNLPILLRALGSLKMLCFVQCICLDSVRDCNPYRKIGIRDASWHRNPSEPSSPFTLDDLRVDCATEFYQTFDAPFGNDATNKVLQATKVVEFRVLGTQQRLEISHAAVPSTIADVIAPRLGQCSSARKLVFHRFPWTRMKTFEQTREQLGTLRNVEELVVKITALPYPPQSDSWLRATRKEKALAKEQFSLNDAQLSRVVEHGWISGLRVLTVIFPKQWLDIYVDGLQEARSRGDIGLVLPHCRQKCVERGICCKVGIV